MQNLLKSGKLLLFDMASTFLLFVVYLATKSMPLTVGRGFAIATGSAFMSGFAIVSKLRLFLTQYVTMRYSSLRRHAQMALAAP
jgi:hypothetical protein